MKSSKTSNSVLSSVGRRAQHSGVKLAHDICKRCDEAEIFTIAFAPTTPVLALGTSSGGIELWNVQEGKQFSQFRGHSATITGFAFGPGGATLASASMDHTIRIWECNGERLLHAFSHGGSVRSLAYDSKGGVLAAAVFDHVILWDVSTGRSLRMLSGHQGTISSLAFDPTGDTILTGSYDGTVRLWQTTSGRMLFAVEAPRLEPAILAVAYDPRGELLASGSADGTVKLWSAHSGKLLRILEGHTGPTDAVRFSSDGKLFCSKSRDGSLHLWRSDSWQRVAVVQQPVSTINRLTGLALHDMLPLLATVGHDPSKARNPSVSIWTLDNAFLLSKEAILSTLHYVNAKVVLVGDTGVGKSGLSLVLNHKQFVPTDSTPGRNVWTFDSREVTLNEGSHQTRETLLWDLAGQPGYRVIHQLYLNEVAVALVVFDARSETDPLAGVRHWERALRLAQQRDGSKSVPMKKLLVSARADRGGVSVSRERVAAICEEFGFDSYFETSAKEGWQIPALRNAIEQAIPWDDLPVVTSEELFVRIKQYLLSMKATGQLLAPVAVLFQGFVHDFTDANDSGPNLEAQFETCIGRLQNRDLIRRLSFGDYILLQPELLDGYASAMVIAAKSEPDGLGSLAEDTALAGKFFVPGEQKIADRGMEQLLLHATVEELVRHDLALQENADDGRYIVFPSQFNRDYEDAPEPKGKFVAMTFEGPVQSLYATLAVRLGHSGMFETGRTEMWRNAALFAARTGGRCGIYMREFTEARGQLVLFHDSHASAETRFHFEEYVLSHVAARALENSIELVRFFVCSGCGTPIPDAYVKMCRSQGLTAFGCPCGNPVSLLDIREELSAPFPSQVAAMDRSADRYREFDALIVSASGEVHTTSFIEWAGGERVMLAIVFTDMVGATALENEVGGERMSEIRSAHFVQGRKLISRYLGREIKTIGDSFMVAFHSVDKAIDFVVALKADPGAQPIELRAGIHAGPITVAGSDVFGGTVNFAARVVSAIEGAELWLSDRAMDDIRDLKAARHSSFVWTPHTGVAMKGYRDTFTLWSLGSRSRGRRSR